MPNFSSLKLAMPNKMTESLPGTVCRDFGKFQMRDVRSQALLSCHDMYKCLGACPYKGKKPVPRGGGGVGVCGSVDRSGSPCYFAKSGPVLNITAFGSECVQIGSVSRNCGIKNTVLVPVLFFVVVCPYEIEWVPVPSGSLKFYEVPVPVLVGGSKDQDR